MNPLLDTQLESPDGRPRSLREVRGRVAVVFWEPRDRLDENAELKRELEALAPARDVVLLGVGDVRAFDLPGVRPVVRRAVGAISAAIGREVWLDWKGALARLGLREGASNVLVLDRDGREIMRASGPLDAGERACVLSAVRALAHPAAA